MSDPIPINIFPDPEGLLEDLETNPTLNGLIGKSPDPVGKGGRGVLGVNKFIQAIGFLAGQDFRFQNDAGVYGQSQRNGVVGVSNGSIGTGVVGVAGQEGNNFDPASGGTGMFGTGYVGVRGDTRTGVAVMGRVFGPGLAGKFEGDVEVTGNIKGHATSTITCFDVNLLGQDCAEEFDLAAGDSVSPGTVMVINNEGALQACQEAYARRVAGIVSGAGDYKPGLILGKKESESNRVPIALLGKVFCKVDADYAAVGVGDLLTTSETLGHAMKAVDQLKSFGAVIGKALRPLTKGQGLIPILIALQ